MDQLIQEMKLFSIDSNQFTPRRDGMTIKNIIDEPTFHNAGKLRVPAGDSTTFYELKNINYVFLNSEQNFDLLLDDTIIINSSQFAFVNRRRNMTVAVQSMKNLELEIDFVYGNVQLGDEDKAVYDTNPECCAKWDVVLKNIIYDPDCDDDSTISFPRVSHIEVGA